MNLNYSGTAGIKFLSNYQYKSVCKSLRQNGTSRSYCCPVVSVKTLVFWFFFLSKCYWFYCNSISSIVSPGDLQYLDTGRLDSVVYNNGKSTVIHRYVLVKEVYDGLTSQLRCLVRKTIAIIFWGQGEVRVLWITV